MPNRTPRFILLAVAVWLFGLAVHSLGTGKMVYAVALLCAVALLVAAGRLAPRWRSRAAFSVSSVFTVVYAAELMLAVLLPVQGGVRASLSNRRYDFRTYHRVIRDLRADGVPAYPFVPPGVLLDDPPLAGLTPLGAIANTKTVYCNEGGDYLLYDSDEHGFHNPPRIWGRPTDVVFAGDSFTQGACVSSRENFVGRVRERFPNTVNLGMAHNGPLLMLASLQEFLPALAPKVVFWCFYEGNDLADLNRERNYPILEQYLSDTEFRQDLVDKQPEVDRAIKAYADRKFDLARTSLPPIDSVIHRVDLRETLFRVIQLNHLLGVVNRAFDQPIGYGVANESDQIPLFGEILAKARDKVEARGGRLVFVLLPGWELAVRRSERRTRIRSYIVDAAGRTGVSVIDLTGPLQNSGDAAAAFWYPGSHYTPAGYGLVARELLRELDIAPPDAK